MAELKTIRRPMTPLPIRLAAVLSAGTLALLLSGTPAAVAPPGRVFVSPGGAGDFMAGSSSGPVERAQLTRSAYDPSWAPTADRRLAWYCCAQLRCGRAFWDEYSSANF